MCERPSRLQLSVEGLGRIVRADPLPLRRWVTPRQLLHAAAYAFVYFSLLHAACCHVLQLPPFSIFLSIFAWACSGDLWWMLPDTYNAQANVEDVLKSASSNKVLLREHWLRVGGRQGWVAAEASVCGMRAAAIREQPWALHCK